MPEQPSVDGVSSAAPTPPPASSAKMPADATKSPFMLKGILLAGLAVPYTIYLLWCLFLLASFPAMGASPTVIMIGVLSMIAGALIFLGAGALGFFRISSSKAMPNTKMIALIKLGAFVLPGFLLSVMTPFMISGEPSLTINIVSPSSSSQFIAPLSISFSVQPAVDALAERGFRPVQYSWDINSDKKVDQQTLTPELTATFDKEGIYTVSVSMKSSDGTVKTASRRFVISQSVFSVLPTPAIVDRPTVFSLSHLYPEADQVTAVAWDFDGDGQIDEANGGIQTSYTYLATGTYTVSAVVQLANKTQAQYQRTVDVTEPAALPFPVTIVTQPKNLIGTVPFAALFSVETEEPVYSVQWDFGDGEKAEGQRATHTFAHNGSFAVTARVRSQSGVIADVGTVVKVVDRLDLNDLRFEGTPEVNGDRITGEVPLTLNLTPVTSTPFVQFSWEAPDATEVGSTETNLQAIFRRPGTFTVTLVGQDLENHVLRQPLTVEVKPPSSVVTFQMNPESGIAPLLVTFDASESSIPDEDITGFVWNFGDGSPQEFGGAVTQHRFLQAGTYTINLTARTISGLQQSTSRTLIVRAPNLQARILASRLTGTAPMTVSFDGTSSIGVVTEYLWDFGDGTQNDKATVPHPFTDPGTYTVRLTVKDANGESATTTVTITVH
jgi:PKD repeat protein